jgi:hypothetical protein
LDSVSDGITSASCVADFVNHNDDFIFPISGILDDVCFFLF